MATIIDRDILLACTRIHSMGKGGTAGGSGTVIYSAKNDDGSYSTYLLSNEHVVDNNIDVKERWDALLRRTIKDQFLGTVDVHFFEYKWEHRVVGAASKQADIMAFDKDEDMALLKIRSEMPVPAVVQMYPKGEESKLRIGMPCVAVGAALGEAPITSYGRLSQFGREIDNREFWLQSAPIIYGNSGGSVFLEDIGEYIGIPSRIAVTYGGDAITHLSYIIPITRIYKFLESQMFRFVYDKSFTEEGERKAREEKLRADRMRMASREIEQGQKPSEQDTDVAVPNS